MFKKLATFLMVATFLLMPSIVLGQDDQSYTQTMLECPLQRTCNTTYPYRGTGYDYKGADGRGFDYHVGEDFSANGDTVVALADGCRVVDSRPAYNFDPNGWGNRVSLWHNPNLHTNYNHLSEILVEPGQCVRQGDPVGISGGTGRVFGAHLHLDITLVPLTQLVWDNEAHYVDPREYLGKEVTIDLSNVGSVVDLPKSDSSPESLIIEPSGFFGWVRELFSSAGRSSSPYEQPEEFGASNLTDLPFVVDQRDVVRQEPHILESSRQPLDPSGVVWHQIGGAPPDPDNYDALDLVRIVHADEYGLWDQPPYHVLVTTKEVEDGYAEVKFVQDESAQVYHTLTGQNPTHLAISFVDHGKAGSEPTEAQVKSMLAVTQFWVTKYGIDPSNVVGHAEVDPSRREDPVGVSMEVIRQSLMDGQVEVPGIRVPRLSERGSSWLRDVLDVQFPAQLLGRWFWSQAASLFGLGLIGLLIVYIFLKFVGKGMRTTITVVGLVLVIASMTINDSQTWRSNPLREAEVQPYRDWTSEDSRVPQEHTLWHEYRVDQWQPVHAVVNGCRYEPQSSTWEFNPDTWGQALWQDTDIGLYVMYGQVSDILVESGECFKTGDVIAMTGESVTGQKGVIVGVTTVSPDELTNWYDEGRGWIDPASYLGKKSIAASAQATAQFAYFGWALLLMGLFMPGPLVAMRIVWGARKDLPYPWDIRTATAMNFLFVACGIGLAVAYAADSPFWKLVTTTPTTISGVYFIARMVTRRRVEAQKRVLPRWAATISMMLVTAWVVTHLGILLSVGLYFNPSVNYARREVSIAIPEFSYELLQGLNFDFSLPQETVLTRLETSQPGMMDIPEWYKSEVRALAPEVRKIAQAEDVPPELIFTLWLKEAGGKRSNPANGEGLFGFHDLVKSGQDYFNPGSVGDQELLDQFALAAREMKARAPYITVEATMDQLGEAYMRYNGNIDCHGGAFASWRDHPYVMNGYNTSMHGMVARDGQGGCVSLQIIGAIPAHIRINHILVGELPEPGTVR